MAELTGKFRYVATPEGVVNHALRWSQCGRAIASPGDRNAELAISGDTSFASFVEKRTGWQSSVPGAFPAFWQVQFSSPREIDTVIVRTWPSHVAGRNHRAIRDYALLGILDKGWEVIDRVQNNMQGVMVHPFSPRSLWMLRVLMTATNNGGIEVEPHVYGPPEDQAALIQVEAYRLGGVSPVCEETVVVEHEAGQRGRVAVWQEPDIPKGPGHGDPDRLTAFFRGEGYGVSILSAKALCCSEIFSRENFDILVHPYGPYFPLGTCLYDFLESGGHLICLGGPAMGNALEYHEGRWQPTGWDPGLTMTHGRFCDYFDTVREQIGLYAGRHHTYTHAASAQPASNVSAGTLKPIQVELSGASVTANVARRTTEAEDLQLCREGRLEDYWFEIKRTLRNNGFRWGDFQDYSILFARPAARWIPLLFACDRLGRRVGTAAALLHHFEGIYRGSVCLASGVENVDLTECDTEWLRAGLRRMEQNTVLHDLMPGYDACHPGERIEVSAWVDHLGREPFAGEVRVAVEGLGEKVVVVNLRPGEGRKVEANFGTPSNHGLYRIHAVLYKGEEVLDEEESGVVYLDPSRPQEGPAFELRDNYFCLDERPTFIVGARDDGLHQHGQARENPLDWDRQYAQQQAMGMRVSSPVFLNSFMKSYTTGEPAEPLIPEVCLRQHEAQAFLANRRGIIYAPALFFEGRTTAQDMPEIAERQCELVGGRLKAFPAVYFYLYDDGHRTDPDSWNRWISGCVNALHRTGRRFLTTAEFGSRTRWPDTIRACSQPLSFVASSVFGDSGGMPHALRLADMRLEGKTYTTAEFGRPQASGSDDERYAYWVEPFLTFVAGHSLILNWKWKDNDHVIFTWGIIHPNDWVPKATGHIYSVNAQFFAYFEPVWRPPSAALLFPHPKDFMRPDQEVHAAHEFVKAMQQARVDFAVVDPWALGRLPQGVRWLVVPARFCRDVKLPKGPQVIAADDADDLRKTLARMRDLPRLRIDPDDPEFVIFRTHTRHGDVHALMTYPRQKAGRAVTLSDTAGPVRMTLENYSLGLVGMNDVGGVFAVAGQGETGQGENLLLRASSHTAWFAEDGKSLSESQSVRLWTDGPGEFRLHRTAPLDALQVSASEPGGTRILERIPLRRHASFVDFSLDAAQARAHLRLT